MYGAVAGITAFGALSGLAAQAASAAVTANNLYGSDRYQTAGNLNAAKFGSGGAATVLLADAMPGTPPTGAGGHQSDALAVSGYAGLNKYGLLLTDNTSTVPANTMTALTNLKVKNVIAVGGTASVTPAQVAQLTAAGYTVTQPFQGADRYATMQMIDSQFTASTVGKDPSGNATAILASGDYAHLVDALAGGGLAYKWKFPVILTPSGSSTLGSQAQQEITSLGIKHLIVVGGTASIPASQYTPAPSGVTTVDVVSGADRSATARALEQLEVKTYQASTTTVSVATGATYYGTTGTVQNDGADALSGAPFNGDALQALCLSAGPGPNDAGSAPACVSDVNPTTANVETGPANLKSLSTILAGSSTGGAGSVTVSNPNAVPGGTFTGTVNTPAQVQSLAVSGCGLTNQAVNFDTTSGNFTATIPSGQANGSCTLTFTASLKNGSTQTTTVPFTVGASGAGQTTRPQLVSAKILQTVTNGNQTANQPTGTYVQYVFNQTVSTATVKSTGFHVYDSAGNRYTPCAIGQGPGGGNCYFTDPTNTSAIDVVFNNGGTTPVSNAPATQMAITNPGTAANLQTTTGAATLVLATVSGMNAISADGPAVTLANTGFNPDGSAPIGSAANQTLTAGTTSAPDLESVSVVGPGAAANTTAVNFVFDQAAYVGQAGEAINTAAGGFDIVLASGSTVQPGSLVAGSIDEESCTAPNVGSNNTGTTTAAGNGTSTITVICPNANNALGTTLTTANIARGVVQAGEVGTTQPAAAAGNACGAGGNFCAPLQASDTPHTASSTPYLTNVQLQPSTTAAQNSVLYTFSQAVTLSAVAKFTAYSSSGATLVAAGATPAAVNGNQVLVNFGTTSLASAVGGSVAVGGVASANTPVLVNSDDELGAANPNATTITPGTVNAPQLTAVKKTSITNAFGQVTNGAIYTFSTAIGNGTAPTTAPVAGGMKLYDQDGTELTCNGTVAGGTLILGTGSNGMTTSQVMCLSYVVSSPAGGGTPTSTQLTAAVLGTSDYGTVFGSTANTNLNNPNPEGAQATT